MNKIVTKTLKDQMLQNRKESLSSFTAIDHRVETVREIDNVLWINDSKSTDMGATAYSMENSQAPLIWIVGCDENERNLDIINDLALEKVKEIICYGKFETAIKYHFAAKIKYTYKKELEDAVELARVNSMAGDVVLFSPACASYANYENFQERGSHFKSLVNQI